MGNMSIRGLAAAAATAIVLAPAAVRAQEGSDIGGAAPAVRTAEAPGWMKDGLNLLGRAGRAALQGAEDGAAAAAQMANGAVGATNQAHRAAQGLITPLGTVQTDQGLLTCNSAAGVPSCVTVAGNYPAVIVIKGEVKANNYAQLKAAGLVKPPREQKKDGPNARHNASDEQSCADQSGSMRGGGQATAAALKDVKCEGGGMVDRFFARPQAEHEAAERAAKSAEAKVLEAGRRAAAGAARPVARSGGGTVSGGVVPGGFR